MSARESKRWVSRVLAAAFALLLPLAVVSWWAQSTVSSTDRWVATLHPLASDPVVTAYLAQEGAVTIVRDFDVERRIAAAIPQGAGLLAPTLTSALQHTIAAAITVTLGSATFQRLWDSENRLTHRVAVDLLEGRVKVGVSRARAVVIDLTPAMLDAITQLDAHGVTFLDPLKQQLSRHPTLSVQILNVRELHHAQRYYHLATVLWWLFPLLGVLSGGGVVMTSRPRRQGVRRVGLVAVGSGLVTYAALTIAITAASPLAPTPPSVTSAILTTMTSALAKYLLWVSLGGGVLAGLAWLTGPSPFARVTRRALGRGARALGGVLRTGASQSGVTHQDRGTLVHSRRLARIVQVADVVVAVVAPLLLWRRVTTLSQLITLVVLTGGWYWFSARLRKKLTGDSSTDAP